MAKTKAKPIKAKKQKPAEAVSAEPRTVKKPQYRSFRLHKRIKAERLPTGAFRLFGQAVRLLGKHWKVFLGIMLIYGISNAVLVQGFNASSGLGDARATFDELFTGDWARLTSGFTIFIYLLGSSGSTVNTTAGAYQLIMTVMVSLALIWTLRQVHAGHVVKVRDGFYRGMSSLVQFGLVLLVITVQLIPMAIGLALYATIVSGNIASTGAEQLIWALLAFGLSLVSFYMITSSIFALYVVTLPDMTPMRALRSTRQLVANRRWSAMRKVLFLPLALVVIAAVIMVPIIIFIAPIAAWAFFALSMLLLPVVHSYMYALYRSML